MQVHTLTRKEQFHGGGLPFLKRQREGRQSLLIFDMDICSPVEEQLHRAGIAFLRGHMQGCEAIYVRDAYLRLMIQQKARQLDMGSIVAVGDSRMKRRPAISLRNIDIRPPLHQQACHLHLPPYAGPEQGSSPRRKLRIHHLRIGIYQPPHLGQIPRIGRIMDSVGHTNRA